MEYILLKFDNLAATILKSISNSEICIRYVAVMTHNSPVAQALSHLVHVGRIDFKIRFEVRDLYKYVTHLQIISHLQVPDFQMSCNDWTQNRSRR